MVTSSSLPSAANVAISSIVFSALFVCLRTYSRWLQNARWMWADIFVPLSLVANLVLSGLFLELYVAMEIETTSRSVSSAKLTSFWVPIVYGFASALPKLAVLDVYLHLFVTRWARWTLFATGIVVAGNGLAYVLSTILECQPIAKVWDRELEGTCADTKAMYTVFPFPNIITDLVMLIVPIPIIMRLNMSWTVKAGVLATFLSGGIGLIASCIRFAMFVHWTPGTNHVSAITITTLVEVTCYLAVACILHMRPLINRIFSRSFGPESVGHLTTYIEYGETRTASGIDAKYQAGRQRLHSDDATSSTGNPAVCARSDTGIYPLRATPMGFPKSPGCLPVHQPSVTISQSRDSSGT